MSSTTTTAHWVGARARLAAALEEKARNGDDKPGLLEKLAAALAAKDQPAIDAAEAALAANARRDFQLDLMIEGAGPQSITSARYLAAIEERVVLIQGLRAAQVQQQEDAAEVRRLQRAMRSAEEQFKAAGRAYDVARAQARGTYSATVALRKSEEARPDIHTDELSHQLDIYTESQSDES
jgi:hypothetical protein